MPLSNYRIVEMLSDSSNKYTLKYWGGRGIEYRSVKVESLVAFDREDCQQPSAFYTIP